MPARSLPSSSTAGTSSGSGAPAPAPPAIHGFSTRGPGGQPARRGDAGNSRKRDGARLGPACHRRASDRRLAAARRAGTDPLVHRQQQRAKRPVVVDRVVELLARAERWRKPSRRVLSASEKIDADVVRQPEIGSAIRRRMDKCGDAAGAPVLDRRVGVEDLRLMRACPRVIEESFLRTAHRIAQARVRKWKGRGAVGAEPCRRRPARVQVDPRGAGDVRHHAVEHLAVALVGVEALVQKVAR